MLIKDAVINIQIITINSIYSIHNSINSIHNSIYSIHNSINYINYIKKIASVNVGIEKFLAVL